MRPRSIGAAIGAAAGLLLLAGAVQAATEAPRVQRCDDTTMQELSDLMRDRSVALDQRTQSLSARERDLIGAEAELRARVAELETTRIAVEALVERADAIRGGRVEALVKSVEAMRPKLAGKMLASTEPDVAVEVLTALSPARTGKILAEMPPETAARFVEALARNSLARR